MATINTVGISRHLETLKSRPRPEPQVTAKDVIKLLAGQIEGLLKYGWTVSDVMKEVSNVSEPPFSQHTLRAAWFRYKREQKQRESGRNE